MMKKIKLFEEFLNEIRGKHNTDPEEIVDDINSRINFGSAAIKDTKDGPSIVIYLDKKSERHSDIVKELEKTYNDAIKYIQSSSSKDIVVFKINEAYVNEVKIEDAEITETISEFYELQMQILQLQSELKQKQAQFKQFDANIQPIIDGMKDTGDKLGVTEKYVVKVSRFGYERTTASYKDAFELALSKVNGATQKILNEALTATEKVSAVSHSYTIDQMNEANIFQKIVSAIKDVASKFVSMFKKESKNIDAANDDLKKLV
jgi:predicted transcriptional regulator